MLFMVPWRGRAMFGTSQSARVVMPGDGEVTPGELHEFVHAINSAFPDFHLREEEVTLVHRGLVPAIPRTNGAARLRDTPAIRDHSQEGIAGAISLVTVKYTTARRLAERAVDRVVQHLGRPTRACATAASPLPGAEVADFEAIARDSARTSGMTLDERHQKHVIETYGSDLAPIVELAAKDHAWAAPVSKAASTIGAEVVHAVRHEMACTLADAVLRRTGLGAAGYPGDEAVAVCADLLARELRWDSARTAREIDDLRRFYLPVGPLSAATSG
jgi:glycerol-3-phosphate dehydrogenase